MRGLRVCGGPSVGWRLGSVPSIHFVMVIGKLCSECSLPLPRWWFLPLGVCKYLTGVYVVFGFHFRYQGNWLLCFY